jgi:large subunit ribosomal protein L20
MPRVKSTVASKHRRKKVLKAAKGFRGGRSKLYRTARESVNRARAYAYHGRKLRKRDMRRLWIIRINAAARLNGLSYSRFMRGLQQAGIALDRKILAELAVHDAPAFAQIAQVAREHQ